MLSTTLNDLKRVSKNPFVSLGLFWNLPNLFDHHSLFLLFYLVTFGRTSKYSRRISLGASVLNTINITKCCSEVGFLKTIAINVLVIPKWNCFKQGSANIFCKGTCSKYFRLCVKYDLYKNYSTLVKCEISHRQYLNKWVWLYSSKTLFIKNRRQPQSGPGAAACKPLF